MKKFVPIAITMLCMIALPIYAQTPISGVHVDMHQARMINGGAAQSQFERGTNTDITTGGVHGPLFSVTSGAAFHVDYDEIRDTARPQDFFFPLNLTSVVGWNITGLAEIFAPLITPSGSFGQITVDTVAFLCYPPQGHPVQNNTQVIIHSVGVVDTGKGLTTSLDDIYNDPKLIYITIPKDTINAHIDYNAGQITYTKVPVPLVNGASPAVIAPNKWFVVALIPNNDVNNVYDSLLLPNFFEPDSITPLGCFIKESKTGANTYDSIITTFTSNLVFSSSNPDPRFRNKPLRLDFNVFVGADFDTTVTDVKETPAYPTGFSLIQNYPNPVHESTWLQYTLDRPMDVALRVFDMLGREVATLETGRQGMGLHNVPFTATQLPNGVYVYSLTANGQTISRTLTIEH